jgi:hypothetical protein
MFSDKFMISLKLNDKIIQKIVVNIKMLLIEN